MIRNLPELDPIGLEILWNGLKSISDEAFVALMKSAYSTNIKERRDHSVTIMDPRGQLIVQSEQSQPCHIGSISGMMEKLLEKYGEEVEDGDIIIANDPHAAGGSHLPDINMAMPVFHEGVLVGYVCDIAHHADMGGMSPGSMAGGMTEIYQEGLRIPLVKLFDKGELRQELFDLLLLNVRVPEERRGDYYAQIAACRLGHRRLTEVLASHGLATIQAGFDQILARTEERMRRAVADLPDGVYRFEDVMDDDGVSQRDMPICVEITVAGEHIRFDFAGTAAQVPGNINLPMNATMASVGFALKALLDPDIPTNKGLINVLDIVAEEGTMVNAVFPAAVAARAHTCQRVVDVVFGALAPCLPERAVAAANGANTSAVFSGVDPKTGESYVYFETLGGGVGGRIRHDGKDGVQANITNTTNLPVEAIESEYPLLVEEYGLIPDSGGAGRQRGGMGLRRVVRPRDHDCIFNGAGERFQHQPWGIFGGAPGATGKFELDDPDAGRSRLDNKPSGVKIRPEQKVIIDTPGAGGYGPPSERAAADLETDRRSGKFSDAFLAEHYAEDRT